MAILGQFIKLLVKVAIVSKRTSHRQNTAVHNPIRF